MYKKAVDLSQYKLRKELIPELEKKLFYLSERIEDFEVVSKGTDMDQIVFTLSEDINLCRELDMLIKSDFTANAYTKDTVLWKSKSDNSSFPNITYNMLRSKEIIFDYGNGRVAVSGPLLYLMRYLDSQIRHFCIQELHAAEYCYPTMIDLETIDKCGYLRTSPHMLFFVQYLHNDMQNYADFKSAYKRTSTIEQHMFHETKYCLPPTMCYHTYCQLEGTVVGNSVYTSVGKSFRYENKYATMLERLWDFTIREMVFFGSYPFVSDVRKRIIGFAQQIVDDLQLSGYCSNANDPFFLDEDASYKVKYQKGLNSKIEMRLHVSKEKTIAVGSFNFHDNFFCRNFNINSSDVNQMISGCTGFGLERFAYAFICQHGLNMDNWPIQVV